MALERSLLADLAAESAADESVVVDRAIGRLTRIEAGTYGMCTRCGSAIPAGRLEIMPESGLCVPCAARSR